MEAKDQNIKEDQAPKEDFSEEKTVTLKESEHKKLLRELEEYKDKNLRLYADFENVRKRMEREKQDFIKYANEGLIIEFLDILDNFERVLDAAKRGHDNKTELLKGIEMVIINIKKLLDRHDVRPIESVGKKFDPHFQEVLMQVESEGQDDGTVLEEFQKGYYLGDRVVRTAKVKVVKTKDN